MLRHISILTSSLALLAAGTAFAQEQPADQSGGATGFDLGEPVEQGPRLGERYIREEFQDWDLACVKTNEDVDPCSILQILTDAENNPVAEVSMFRISGSDEVVAGGTIIVPLETLLPAEMGISVDGAPGRRYGYSFCNPVGCVAQVGFTQADIDGFKRGNVATVSIVAAARPDLAIELSMSLSGFTAAYDVVDIVPN